MNALANNLIETTVQCWGCEVFDRLFQVISTAAAVAYKQFAILCAVLFCVLMAFFILNAVWKNIRGGVSDPFYMKSIKPVLINSLVALSLLAMGVFLPRFVTTITFEPTAQIALIYTQGATHTDSEIVNERVTYQPQPMNNNGFYRPQLRDTIIMLMKTTITQFQSYMKLGVAVMESAFSWNAILGIGALIKHIILFLAGMYIFWGFFKLFLRFCFYFADIIIEMAFFAFFFPLSLVMMSFKTGDNIPGWMSGLGKNVGAARIKKLIGAIIALAAAVMTYTVIMALIAKFFSAPDMSTSHLMELIMTGAVSADDLSTQTLMATSLGRIIIFVYVLNFIYAQIPQVTKMVLGVFGTSSENSLSEQLANDAEKLTSKISAAVTTIGKTVISGGEDTGGKK